MVSVENKNMEQLILDRIRKVQERVPGSIGDILQYKLVRCDDENKTYYLQCSTQDWMRNPFGILHGGLCATILDHAMGIIAYCVRPGKGQVPTINLQVSYHRPLIPGEDALVAVKVISVTRSLITLSAEASLPSAPEKACMTATATFFYKPEVG